jgi:hypothetical protein
MAIGPIYSAAIYGAFVAAIGGGVGPAVVLITALLTFLWVE